MTITEAAKILEGIEQTLQHHRRTGGETPDLLYIGRSQYEAFAVFTREITCKCKPSQRGEWRGIPYYIVDAESHVHFSKIPPSPCG